MRLEALNPKRLFFITLWTTLGLRFLLAASIPVTGDEAYFFLWGRHPALGYYDHPPMTGLMLAALLSVGDALWWLRLPSVLLSSFIGLGIVYLIKERDEELAWLTGALYLIVPISALKSWYSLFPSKATITSGASAGANLASTSASCGLA